MAKGLNMLVGFNMEKTTDIVEQVSKHGLVE
jgi:hypothetical protein